MKLDQMLNSVDDGNLSQDRSLALKGTAVLDTSLTINRSLSLCSEGAEIRFEGAEACLRLVGNGPFLFRGIRFIHQQELAPTLVCAVDAQVLFEDCRFEGSCGGTEVKLASAVTSEGSSRLLFRNCHFSENDLHLKTLGTSSAELRECQLRYARADGIQLFEESRVQLSHCHVSESGWTGIQAKGLSSVVLSTSVLAGNQCHGVLMLDATTLQSRDNRYWGNTQNGLCAQSAGSLSSLRDKFPENKLCGVDLGEKVHAIFREVDASANESHGFQLRDRSQALLSQVTVRDNLGSGLALFGESGIKSEELDSVDNGLNGIQCGDKTNLALSRSKLGGNLSSGLAAFGQSRLVLERSRLSECLGYGLQATQHALLRLTDCEIVENRKGGLLIADSAVAQCVGNTMARNGLHGIAVSDAGQATLTDNLVQGNKRDGILLLGKGDCQLLSNKVLKNERHGIFGAAGSRPLLEQNVCEDNSEEQICLETDSARGVDRSGGGENSSQELPPGVTLKVEGSPELHVPFQPKAIEKTMLMALMRHGRLSEAALGKAAKSRRAGGAMENLIDRLNKAGAPLIRHEGDGPEGNVYALKIDTSRRRVPPGHNQQQETQGRQTC